MQYLSEKTITDNIPLLENITTDNLISADTYNEAKILQKFMQIDHKNQRLLYMCAIQISIIGYGNKNYGSIRDEDDKVYEIKTIFNQNGIKFNEQLSAKYSEDELSARRLLRLFREHIKKFIEKNNRPSYLWIKYADKSDLNEKYKNICFPGAEHLIKTKEEALFLLNTYRSLDNMMNTKFSDRLKRIYIARKIYTFNEVEKL